MKIALVLAASVIASGAAFAQTTIIEKRSEPSTTVIEKHQTAPTVVEKRSVEVTGSVGCSTTTKSKTDEFGDTKVKQKTEC